ncbi:TrmB family transcriptional regulator sugar-binding domain-containing protein [Methanothermococcus sp.]|uniref:TrmB family transcriptional regulator sugar-binding domain-containing protein n=1 Tax=Methanothermococcus sp. TaxID=2614238 RepID=UPI0025EDFD39|nr:TrmB family transcriptional regulator sugar-binding domain-containing protein [Methanothermococcus sp.]
MKKIGILEILVILAILITSGALAYKFINSNNKNSNYEFDGDQMYKCAWVSEKIMNKNFPLYAHVKGKWTSSKEEFNDTVLITGARGGTLYAIYKNQSITIGGEMAYVEDIAAKKIILKPLGNSIIEYQLNPIDGNSFKEIKNKIESTEYKYKNLNLTILKTYIEGSLAADSKTFAPSEQQNIKNNLYLDLNNKNNRLSIYFVENGLFINGKLDLETLNTLDDIINPHKITTSQITVYLVVNETADKIPKNITAYNNNSMIIALQ